jgi:phosphoribosyl-AMP cyclohydrolase
MNQQSFDDIIKKKVGEYSAPVPADAWDNIMGGKKKRRVVFFWWVFGVLIAGGIAVGGYGVISKGEKVDDETSSSEQKIINKNKVTGNVHQPLINKDSEAGKGYQELIDKGNVDDHQILISRNTTDSISNVIDIQPIKTYYFSTLIDYSIAHVPVDTNRIKKAAKKSIWTIDFSITPFIPVQKNEALSYLQRTKITDGHQAIYTANETQTSEELSFAYSVAVRRKINKKLELGTGLQYSRIREKVWLSGKEINTTFSVIQRLHNDNSGPYLLNATYESNTSGTRIINAYNSYNTFSIPVFIQYALTEQRYFSLYLNTGAYVNVIRKYSNSIDGNFNVAYVSGMKQGSHKMNMGVDLFAGLRLASPGKKYRFFAEPNFRYSFMKNNTSNMINAKYIHQAGLSVGISYHIN